MRLRIVALAALAVLSGGLPARAADIPSKAPGADTKGELCEWKAKDGLVYHHRLPASYDPEKGANLTLILHGSNLTHGWGFANHSAKSFRPDDIVVSPDGTTPNGNGGFNFLGASKDAKRLHALVAELKEALNVRQTFLYGHSQGSFFAFYYAGLHPKDVDGVVGHASGTWKGTATGKKGHHQAIVFMHGTQDPVVPYDQSVWGYAGFEKAKYPMLRLRSLEHWNHWPAEHNGPVPHTSQQLAWCEGMTTSDPQRLKACLDVLAANKARERHDYAALYSLCERIGSRPPSEKVADAETLARAAKLADRVQALAQAHADAIQVPEKGKFDGGAWIGHLPVFLRAFRGVPPCRALRTRHAKLLAKHEKDVLKPMRKHWQARNKGKQADAFEYGVQALEKGFLHYLCWDAGFRKNLAEWRKAADALGLAKSDVKAYDAMIEAFEKALADGDKAFQEVNKTKGEL
jgi:predicted esterase